MRRGIVVAAVSLLASLAGCFSLFVECDAPAAWNVATPRVDGRYLDTDPSQAWDTLLFDPGYEGSGNASLAASVAPAAWSVRPQRLSEPGSPTNLSLLRLEPGPGAAELTVRKWAEVAIAEGCASGQGSSTVWRLAEPEAGDAARPDQGAHVMTAGFWENGTLFYTNIAAIDTDPAWPKAGWYAWAGADPLPVYVYGSDRAEQPVHWTDVQSGTPVAGTVPGVGYFTTIPGFNDALQGLSTTTTRVVRLAPEEAYTRPGNEDHPLYGDAIVFYIKVLDVVDFPCPLWVDAGFCRLPDAPLATPTAAHHG